MAKRIHANHIITISIENVYIYSSFMTFFVFFLLTCELLHQTMVSSVFIKNDKSLKSFCFLLKIIFRPICPLSNSLLSVSLPLWPKLFFSFHHTNEDQHIGSDFLSLASPSAIVRSSESFSSSCTFSGDSFVCLQQLNRSLNRIW